MIVGYHHEVNMSIRSGRPNGLTWLAVIRSTGARSLGNGNQLWTSSKMERPLNQTSAQMVYSLPVFGRAGEEVERMS